MLTPATNGESAESRLSGIPSKSTMLGVENDKIEPIAIIGFSARLPQDGDSAEGFWRMLCEGRSAASEIPEDRFNAKAFYHPDVDRIDTMHVKSANFLRGNIAAFDAPFFSIQPSEVMSMDPQQRCMLEASYRALENAGLPIESIAGSKTCVFVGNSARDYEALLLRDPESPAKYIGTGIGTSMLANRVSWFYDLRGPSVALDTACSSSLSALHHACQSLRSHESRMGLVGGCNLILAPDVSIIPLTNMGFFSPDGKCFSFDHRANGYAKGEGAGFIVIKAFTDAVKDGDTIRAVIRATGANQDGKTPGLTQPSQKAQEENIRETYCRGGLDLSVTKYFESHGTGTQIGDPIEAGAINAAFQRTRDNPLYIGALKPNIGHLEAASSVAGLIKSVMILEKGLIPPNINFEEPNVNIPAESWHIKFPLEPTPFPTTGLRRVSINSFGYGGSNTHAVLDDAFNYMKSRGIDGKHNTVSLPPTCESLSESPKDVKPAMKNGATIACTIDGQALQPKLLVFSAADEDGLGRLKTAYQAHFSKLPEFQKKDPMKYLENLSYTLSNKRSILPWKSFILAHSFEKLLQNLSGDMAKPVRSSTGPALSLIFTGQGAQWAGMGRELCVYPVFRNSLSRSQIVLENLGWGWDLIDKMGTKTGIDSPGVAQPLCTALQIAIVDLLTSWRIFPRAVAGHSSGEIAAAYCARGLSHDSAIRIAFYRGSLAARLEERESKMAMTSINLSEPAITHFISELNSDSKLGGITVGCVNSPNNVTVTGDRRGIDAINALMEKMGIFARRLPVTVAYHSVFMMEIADEYLKLVRDVMPLNTPTTSQNGAKSPTMFSTVTGAMLSPEHLNRPDYWVTNLVSKVRFSDAIGNMVLYLLQERATGDNKKDLLVEIGPTSALQRPVKDIIDNVAKSENITYDSILKRDTSGIDSCLALIGRAWISGFNIDLVLVNSPTTNESKLQLLVDLPEYPFNHANTYWTESRISKKFRMRKHARHDLLGVPLADWNPLEPRWRNVIRVKENPWILHHTIQGSQLYPAAGMIIMAIEGIRQITSPEKSITGYKVENLAINKALVVTSAAEGIESQLHFHSRKGTTNGASDSYSFTLYAYSNEEWASICEGNVTVEFEERFLKVVSGEEAGDMQFSLNQRFEAGVKNCKDAVNSQQFYRNLAAFGFDFGPTFQSLERIRYNETGEATAVIELDGWEEKTSNVFFCDNVIHPTALDGMLHLTIAATSKGSWESIPTYVPTQAKSLWISNELLIRAPKSHVEAYTKRMFHGYREDDFWIAATNADKKLMVLVEGWRMTALSSLDSSSAEESGLQCYYIEWKPDLALMETTQIATYCEANVSSDDLLSATLIDRWELVCLFFMSMTAKLAPQYKELAPHLQKYLEWTLLRFDQSKLDHLLSINVDNGMLDGEGPSQQEALTDFAKSSAEGALHVAVGQNIKKVFDGEVDSLDLLFSTSLVQNFYHSPSFGVSYRKIAAYIDLLAHKNPDLRILEIGAGTGAATGPILRSLFSDDLTDGIPRFSQYTYTDISPAFFQDAKERFQSCSNRMRFSTLDIEKDPLDQGFEAEQFDVIICGLVLHATADLNNTLQNTRKILKPGGKLVLFEPSNPEATRVSFVFGLLPGWWLGTEEKRRQGPLLSAADWHEILLENAFSGAEIHLPDYHDERHTFSIIVSTALGTESTEKHNRPGRKTVIVIGLGSAMQSDVAVYIKAKIQSTMTASIEVCKLEELDSQDLEDTLVIFLLEIDTPFLVSMSDDDFAALKVMTSSTDGVLWVTQGCGERSPRPELGLITGFGRNMGSEDISRPFVELAIEANTSVSQTVDLIIKVFYESLLSEKADKETEYMQKDGLLCLSRVVNAPDLSQRIATKTMRPHPKMQLFKSETPRALELSIRSPGQLDTLHFKDDERVSVRLASHEVEIKVQATGLELEDVKIALGQLPGNTLGSECAGVVTLVGDGVESFQAGDRVCCYTKTGAFNTYVRAQTTATAKIPKDMSYRSAAALPVAFCLAWYSLVCWARIQEGDRILIHSGAEALGQAAIQIARLHKADVFTTVDGEESKRLVVDRYGLEESHVFSAGDRSLTSRLMRVTDGVDVVLSSLSGEGWEDSLACIKPFGRFIGLGQADLQSHAILLQQNVSFISVDLGLILEKGNAIMEATMGAIMDLLASRRISAPQPLHVYSVSQIQQAFQDVQSENLKGKTVIEMHDDAAVPVLPSTKPSYSFDPDATYVISGGLGGLGRSIVRWMADRQARHFLLLSRSGAVDKTAIELIEEMNLRSVRVATPSCDVSVEDAVLTTLQEAKQNMPTIKGCIQASMVLKDGLFENMSLEDFNTAIRPKVHGSWNLHKHLPRNMDFYVLLSSITGVTGSRGQRNYACGNTYQNALARHRVSHGQKCISLDLGAILSIGFAAEKDLSAALEKDGFQGIRKAELFALLDHCCNPSLPLPDPWKSEIVTGLGGLENMKADRLQEVYWTRKPLFSLLRQKNCADAAVPTDDATSSAINYENLIKTAASQIAAETVVVQALVRKLAAGLSIPIQDIDVDKAIYSFGIDSLVALEVRYWFSKELKADVTIFDIMQSQSVLALGKFAAGKSAYRQGQ